MTGLHGIAIRCIETLVIYQVIPLLLVYRTWSHQSEFSLKSFVPSFVHAYGPRESLERSVAVMTATYMEEEEEEDDTRVLLCLL